MNKIIKIFIVAAASVTALVGCTQKNTVEKPRMIITCDPELDDNNSMIRYVLHAADFRIEALIYTSSQYHWLGDGKGTTCYRDGREYTKTGRFGVDFGPQTEYRFAKDEKFIDDIVDAYAASYKNLKVHDPNYPTPEYLKSIIYWGNVYLDGDYSYDSDGSRVIKEKMLDDVPGKLFINAWGGGSSIAAALRSIEEEYKGTPEWDAIYTKVSNKVILCNSGDQDDTYRDYTSVKWPDIHVWGQRKQTEAEKQAAANRPRPGDANFDMTAVAAQYSRRMGFVGTEIKDPAIGTPAWTQKYISSQGPLGALWRCWGDGKFMVKNDMFDYMGFSSEEYTDAQLRKMGYVVWTPLKPKGTMYGDGDSGCYYMCIDNGLRTWMDDSWGSWGSTPARQYDLAARLKWSNTPNYADANHYPVIKGLPLDVKAAAGSTLKLNAKVSDPDGDNVTCRWWFYSPAGSYKGETVAFADENSASTSVVIPADAKSGDTIHLVLEANDGDEIPLIRYHRVVVTVK